MARVVIRARVARVLVDVVQGIPKEMVEAAGDEGIVFRVRLQEDRQPMGRKASVVEGGITEARISPVENGAQPSLLHQKSEGVEIPVDKLRFGFRRRL